MWEIKTYFNSPSRLLYLTRCKDIETKVMDLKKKCFMTSSVSLCDRFEDVMSTSPTSLVLQYMCNSIYEVQIMIHICIPYRDTSVGMATGYAMDGRGSIPDRGTIFLFTASIPALGPTQPPIQWVLVALSRG
jgi:hypothetical protein